ncbi:MAG: tetratricopeptide repeat protein [Treponema sp.]|nr:tetratricopeptide repeat protein [Treponema sp.]
MLNINRLNIKLVKYLFIFLFSLFFLFAFSGCITTAATAEEYFELGMAFFELGRFEDAERWLNRARQADRTYVASQYNLGRLAFERQRFEEAAAHFEGILRRDPDNVLALRASAYTRIRMGDIDIARRHYARLLELVPESADDGYNHALVLFAMGLYEEAEFVLERHAFALRDSRDMQLLFARSQARQNKVEAIDSFANFLTNFPEPEARFEYAAVLEHHEFYSRALDELRLALTELTETTTAPTRNDINFAITRVLLIADGESSQGITELEALVAGGFNNIEAIEELTNHDKISAGNIENLDRIIRNLRAAVPEETPQDTTPEDDDTDDMNWDWNLETYSEGSS